MHEDAIEVTVKNVTDKARLSAKPWVTISTNAVMGTFALSCDDTKEEAGEFLSRIKQQSERVGRQMGLKPADDMRVVHKSRIKWVLKN